MKRHGDNNHRHWWRSSTTLATGIPAPSRPSRCRQDSLLRKHHANHKLFERHQVMSELTTWSSTVSICFLLEILMADLRNLFQVSWKNRLDVQLVNGAHMLELLSHGNPTTNLPVYQTSKRYIRRFLRMLWQKGWGSNISASFCGNLSFPKNNISQETCLDSHRHDGEHPCCWVCNAVLCVACAVRGVLCFL